MELFSYHDTEMDEAIRVNEDWIQRVENYLKDNFTHTDWREFAHLGVIPHVTQGNAYNDEHRRLLMQYALREQRLRQIIDRHTRRDWILQV